MYYILGSNLSTRKYQSLLTKSQTRNTSTSKNIVQQNKFITLKIKNTFTSRHDIYWIMPPVRNKVKFPTRKGSPLRRERRNDPTRDTYLLFHRSPGSPIKTQWIWSKCFLGKKLWKRSPVNHFSKFLFVRLSEAKHINVIPTANLKKSIVTECHIKQYG